MEAVYGVAAAGEARKSFVAYIRSRSRRVVRGHDQPYAMFESFGGKPDGDYNVDEKYLLDNLARLGEAQKSSPAAFDFYNIEFWVDTKGTSPASTRSASPTASARSGRKSRGSA